MCQVPGARFPSPKVPPRESETIAAKNTKAQGGTIFSRKEHKEREDSSILPIESHAAGGHSRRFAADTTETYALVKVESAVEGREISFKGRIVDPDGDFWISLEDGTTPYEERFVADDLVGLFRNLDPDVGMVVSLDLVEDGSWKSGLTADWDFAMIMKRGDEIMTAGL